MKKLFFTIALVLAFACDAQAAKRMLTPEICGNSIDEDQSGTADDGCPASSIFSAVTGGIAADAKDARITGTFATATDTESSSGTYLKTTGNFRSGQFAIDGNATGTYYLWAKVRVDPLSNNNKRFIWIDTSPFTWSTQNENASFVSAVSLPAPPSFGWVKIGKGNQSGLTFTNTARSFVLAGDFTLYGLTTSSIEIDCWFFTTTASDDVNTAAPICPAGAPSTGIALNAAGTAATGTAVSSVAPTITVAAGSNRVMYAAISHRTDTNTISSVSSSVDGAFTLLNWANNQSIVGCAVYQLIAPSTGAHTVTVSFSEAQNAAAGLVAYNGVNQTTPTSTVTTSFGTGDPSDSISGAVDQLAVDHLCVSVATAETVSVAAGQTQRYQTTIGIASTANRVDLWSDKQGDSSATLAETISGTRAFVHQAFMLKPPSAAGGAPVVGTPVVTLVGVTSASVEASVDDPSASCEVEYEPDGGVSPPYTSTTGSFGATGGKCKITLTGLSSSTDYVFRINATNGNGTTNSTEGTFSTTAVQAVTALGITQAEIDIWNSRRVNGPYRTAGDVQTNSPGDWTRINSNATAFRAGSNTAETWTGWTGAGCYNNTTAPGSSPYVTGGRTRGETLRDTAFRFLLMGDTADRDAVLAGLLDQAAQAGTDFSNTTKWSINTGCATGDSMNFEISFWLIKLAYAWDYIRWDPAISGANKTTIDTWFTNAATFWQSNIQATVAGNFPNRLSDDYATLGSNATGCFGGSTTHKLVYFGGPTRCSFHEAWNNRSALHVLMSGIVGIITNNATLKDRAKRWYQEWVRFEVFSDNTVAEFSRWTADTDGAGPILAHPTLSWAYAGTLISEMAALADWFARAGDRSLIDYTTSLGHDTASLTPSGGPKSLQLIITKFMQHADGTVVRYGTADPALNGNINYRIDTNDEIDGSKRTVDQWLTQPNVYFNDSYIKSIYLRQAPNTLAYPSSPANGGYSPYEGPWGILPGSLFMFGQMEGQVNPYP